MAKMTEKESLEFIWKALFEIKVDLLKTMEYSLYALESCCGGNLEDYLRAKAKYKSLSKAQTIIEDVLYDKYEF